MREKVGVISSEDFLSKLHKFINTLNDEGLTIYNPENDEHVNGDRDKVIMMIASDVVALFPSMRARETAQICSEMVERSDLEFGMLDYQEMLLYIRLNRDKVSKLGYLEHYLPVRSKTGGRSPGMKMKQLRHMR